VDLVEQLRAAGGIEEDEHEHRVAKLRRFDGVCSQIEEKLFLGSNTVAGVCIGLYTIFFHLFVCVQESIIPLLPPPICITHATAIRLRDSCAIFDLPTTLLLYAIHHTMLVVTI